MQRGDQFGPRAARGADAGQLARRRQAPRAGFALLELTIALVVLTVGLVGMMQAGSRTHALSRENAERAAAHNALRSMTDRILARSDAIVRAGGEDWARGLLDVYGPGGTAGDTFDVRSLNRVDSDVPCGSITIVTDETVDDATLGVAAGMPRDLDGDGTVDSNDVSASARKLPVLLEVRWRGFRGLRTLRHVVWVTGV